MPTVVQRILDLGKSPMGVVVLRDHKANYYKEEDVITLLDFILELMKEMAPLKKKVEKLKARSAEYLEVYKEMNKRLERAEYIRVQQLNIIKTQREKLDGKSG